MTSTPPGRLRAPRSRAIVAILLSAGLAAVTGGCDVRLDGPAPAARTAGATEQARERAVADALDLADDARAAARSPGGRAARVAPVLAQVAAFSTTHVDALGGRDAPDASTSPTSSAGPSVSVQDVLDELAAAAGTALRDADAVDDGGLARLLASVGTARDELTTRLAAAAHLTARSAAAPTPSPTPRPTAPAPTPAPTPLDAADASALVLAHDQAGFGFEALAAAARGADRKAAVAAAAGHREQASRLASEAGLDGTGDDPRRAAYTLPPDLVDAAARSTLARSLEAAVAAAAASAVAHSGADARGPWLDELRAATAAARTWGAPATPFPGMPELAAR